MDEMEKMKGMKVSKFGERRGGEGEGGKRQREKGKRGKEKKREKERGQLRMGCVT